MIFWCYFLYDLYNLFSAPGKFHISPGHPSNASTSESLIAFYWTAISVAEQTFNVQNLLCVINASINRFMVLEPTSYE